MTNIPSDHKVQLGVRDINFKFDGLLSPLAKTGRRLVFPYTPTINIGHTANYGTYDMVHSVYQQNYYVNSPNPNISITAQFSSNSQSEAEYTCASIHFLKSLTKPDFGEKTKASTAGLPPPIAMFSGYGDLHFNNVPVIVRNFTYTLVEDGDYVTVNYEGFTSSVPTMMLAQIELTPQQLPKNVRENFNVKSYRNGSLLKGEGGGFI